MTSPNPPSSQRVKDLIDRLLREWATNVLDVHLASTAGSSTTPAWRCCHAPPPARPPSPRARRLLEISRLARRRRRADLAAARGTSSTRTADPTRPPWCQARPPLRLPSRTRDRRGPRLRSGAQSVSEAGSACSLPRRPRRLPRAQEELRAHNATPGWPCGTEPFGLLRRPPGAPDHHDQMNAAIARARGPQRPSSGRCCGASRTETPAPRVPHPAGRATRPWSAPSGSPASNVLTCSRASAAMDRPPRSSQRRRGRRGARRRSPRACRRPWALEHVSPGPGWPCARVVGGVRRDLATRRHGRADGQLLEINAQKKQASPRPEWPGTRRGIGRKRSPRRTSSAAEKPSGRRHRAPPRRLPCRSGWPWWRRPPMPRSLQGDLSELNDRRRSSGSCSSRARARAAGQCRREGLAMPCRSPQVTPALGAAPRRLQDLERQRAESTASSAAPTAVFAWPKAGAGRAGLQGTMNKALRLVSSWSTGVRPFLTSALQILLRRKPTLLEASPRRSSG
jgi:hypothetical protein